MYIYFRRKDRANSQLVMKKVLVSMRRLMGYRELSSPTSLPPQNWGDSGDFSDTC